MTADELNCQLKGRLADIETAQNYWQSMMPNCPSVYQFGVWADLHDFETLLYGIAQTARKFARLGEMSSDHQVRFASSVMNTRKTQETMAVARNAVQIQNKEATQ